MQHYVNDRQKPGCCWEPESLRNGLCLSLTPWPDSYFLSCLLLTVVPRARASGLSLCKCPMEAVPLNDDTPCICIGASAGQHPPSSRPIPSSCFPIKARLPQPGLTYPSPGQAQHRAEAAHSMVDQEAENVIGTRGWPLPSRALFW